MAIDRQTVRTQGRRVVRKVARTVPLSALASLPAQGGPLGHRALLAQARLLLGTPDGTERGLALLQSVPDSARDGATHALMAQALVDLGRPEQARAQAPLAGGQQEGVHAGGAAGHRQHAERSDQRGQRRRRRRRRAGSGRAERQRRAVGFA